MKVQDYDVSQISCWLEKIPSVECDVMLTRYDSQIYFVICKMCFAMENARMEWKKFYEQSEHT